MLELKHISKKFQDRVILDDISIKFQDVGFVGIKGESGCGKSTLLSVIGQLDQDYEGSIYYNEEEVINENQYIRDYMSYMMQTKDMIAALTVRENIVLATKISQHVYQESTFKKIIAQLEISQFLDKYPSQLSGGQLKRVSIAKALLKNSTLLLCDEPTGALHQKQAHEVMELLKKASETSLVIIVSHDATLLKQYCDSVLTLQNGKLKGRLKKMKSYQSFIPQKHHYSLWFYTFKQLLYQRNKLLFLFLFQWIVIVAFFLIVTSMNGVFDAILKSEDCSVDTNMISIERKDGEFFPSLLQNQKSTVIEYGYHLERIKLQSQQKDISALLQILPINTSHIQLKSGRLPISPHEIIVSETLYQNLQDKKTVSFFINNQKTDMNIVGVLEPYFFQNQEIYCARKFQNEIKSLENKYVIQLETQYGNSRELYQQYSVNYRVYSDVIERVDNYQSLLSLAKMVAYVFIGISFFISLLLIAIVESTIYFERQHDIAYLLSLGLSQQKLFWMSVFESLVLGIVMAMGGCLLSTIGYYYFNYVYSLIHHYSFELVLKPILFSQYDIYFVIFISYMLMTILAALTSIMKMMKTNILNTLREE